MSAQPLASTAAGVPVSRTVNPAVPVSSNALHRRPANPATGRTVMPSLSPASVVSASVPSDVLRSGPRPGEPGPDRWSAYRLAFEWSLDLQEVSRYFPPNEQRSLTEPLRLASRRLCVQLAAAWRRRDRPVSHAAALEEAADTLAELRIWLDFARHGRCITEDGWRTLGRTAALVEQAWSVPIAQPGSPG